MRWYVNDASLQGQFVNLLEFESILRALATARTRIARLRMALHTMRTLPERPVSPVMTVRRLLGQAHLRDLRSSVLIWLDRTGPFVEDDRHHEPDDYFEYSSLDVTESGLGEAARRLKGGELASTFSFRGGSIDFTKSPLTVNHGLPEERLGIYSIENCWTVEALSKSAISQGPPITSWRLLVESSRERFPRLLVPDSVYLNVALAREPFEPAIRDRALALFQHLDTYMSGRGPDGAESGVARSIIDEFFVGDRAIFTGESPTNQRDYKVQLTFTDPDDPRLSIFAHWHGKISHRFFRMHFEWPVPANATRLKVVYLGPKLTK